MLKNMDECIALKKSTSLAILNLLNNFNEQTGLIVADINLLHDGRIESEKANVAQVMLTVYI
jgi:hypothetical protein